MDDHAEESKCVRSNTAAGNPYLNCTWIQLHDALIEKEYELQCMSDQLSKLAVLEAEEERKNEIVAELRKELAAHKKNSWSKDLAYVSMEEHLASCESHLQERMSEVKSIQMQLEECREQLRGAVAKGSSLQKQLLAKNTTIATQRGEGQRLQQQNEATVGALNTVRQECRDKQRIIASLQDKVKRFKEDNQGLQKRLETGQATEEQLVATDRKSKAELSKTKGYIATMKQLQTRCQFLEEEIAKTKERESDLACKLGNKDDEMTALCQQLLTLTSSGAVDHVSCCPDAVVQAVSPLVEQNAELQEKLQVLAEELQQSRESLTVTCGDAESIAQCLEGFKGYCEAVEVATVMEAALGRLDTLLCESAISSLRACVYNCLRCAHTNVTEVSSKWSELIQQLASECKNMENEGQEDPFKMVSTLAGVARRKTTECQTLRERLSQSELEHKATLSGAMVALKLDEESKILQAVNHAKKEEQDRFKCELDEAQRQMETEKEAALSTQQEIAKTTAEELDHTKKVISQLEAKVAEKEQIEAQVVALEATLTELEESNSQALSAAEEQKETLRHQLLEEVSSYKEKGEQYALTIVALEEKLLPLVEREQALERENGQLREQLADQTDKGGVGNCEPGVAVTEETSKVEKLEQLTSVLRHQLVIANQEHSKRETEVLQLENDLDTIRNELKEREASMREQVSAETSDLMKTLSAQEGVIEDQRQEITHLTEQLKASTATQTQISKDKEETQLTASLHAQERTTKQQKTTSELLRAGERCMGERHGNVIDNQKEAITQLKRGLADALLARPPGPTHQVTLRELSKVREELLQSKAGQMKGGANKVKDESSSHISCGKESTEVLEILRCSEKSYDSLVDTLCAGLSIERPHGDSILPQEGSIAIWNQALCNRQKFTEKVSKLLTRGTGAQSQASNGQRFQRMKPSRASSIDSERGAISSTDIQMFNPVNKIAELEMKLATTTEELEQQKRLNHALFRRKSFREVLSRETSARPKHTCTSNRES